MKRQFFSAFVLFFLCFSTVLVCQDLDPAEEAMEIEEEDYAEEEVDQDINDEFDEFEENDGVYTEETGPIGTDYYIDIANGAIETYSDRYAREDSYFADLDKHINDDTLHVEEH